MKFVDVTEQSAARPWGTCRDCGEHVQVEYVIDDEKWPAGDGEILHEGDAIHTGSAHAGDGSCLRDEHENCPMPIPCGPIDIRPEIRSPSPRLIRGDLDPYLPSEHPEAFDFVSVTGASFGEDTRALWVTMPDGLVRTVRRGIGDVSSMVGAHLAELESGGEDS
jgi:hypothetical protein